MALEGPASGKKRSAMGQGLRRRQLNGRDGLERLGGPFYTLVSEASMHAYIGLVQLD